MADWLNNVKKDLGISPPPPEKNKSSSSKPGIFDEIELGANLQKNITNLAGVARRFNKGEGEGDLFDLEGEDHGKRLGYDNNISGTNTRDELEVIMALYMKYLNLRS